MAAQTSKRLSTNDENKVRNLDGEDGGAGRRVRAVISQQEGGAHPSLIKVRVNFAGINEKKITMDSRGPGKTRQRKKKIESRRGKEDTGGT